MATPHPVNPQANSHSSNDSQLSQLLARVSDGVLIVDRYFAIVEANEAAAAQLGIALTRLTTQKLSQLALYPTEQYETFEWAELQRALARGEGAYWHAATKFDKSDENSLDTILACELLPAIGGRDDARATILLRPLSNKSTGRQQTRSDTELSYEFALESSQQGAWEWDVNTKHYRTSRLWREMFGYNENAPASKFNALEHLVHPDERAESRRALIGALKGELEIYELHERLRHHDGHYLHCLTRCRVSERDADGLATKIIGTHTNITSLIETQEALAESNERLNLALQHANQGIWEWNPQTDEFTLFGHLFSDDDDTEEISIRSGAELLTLTHPDDREAILTTLTNYMSGSIPEYLVEQRVSLGDGVYRTFLARGQALERAADGNVTRMLGAMTDITEINTHHRRLELALENGRQGMWEWHPKSDQITFSDSWYSIFGYKNGALRNVRSDFSPCIHPDDYQTARSALIGLIKGEVDDYSIEYRIRSKAGEYIWIMERSSVVERDADRRARLVLGTHVDISSQKAVERKLTESRRFLRLVIDSIPDLVFWKDTNSRYLGANRCFGNAAGFDNLNDVVGLSDRDMPWSDDAALFVADDRRVMQEGERHRDPDEKFVDAGGLERAVETQKFPLLDESGEVVGLLGIAQQVTERRRHEKQMEKLAESITHSTQGRLLDALAKGAVELSGVANAFVARLDEQQSTATIVSAFPPDSAFNGVSYPIEQTPCASAISDDACVYADGVQEAFPNDLILRDKDLVAYAGKRLMNSAGEPIGIFFLLDTKEIPDPQYAASVLNVVAATAAAELEREQREIALGESESRYRTTYDNVPVMICTVDDDNNVTDVNKAFEVATGCDVAKTIGSPFLDHFADQSKRRLEPLLNSATTAVNAGELRLELRKSDGSVLPISYNAANTISATGSAVTIAVMEDISARLFAEQQLRLTATAFETHEALVIRDADKKILRANTAYKSISGYGDIDLIGQAPANINISDHEEARIWGIVDSTGKWDGERNSQRADGTRYAVWQTITAVRDDSGVITHYVENSTDVSELKDALAEARRLSLFDPLTELPNRRYLGERLEASIAQAKRSATKGALLFIDLDQFKTINDSLGHGVGDALLIQVSKRLKRLMRKEDTISRLGGDEFVIVLSDLGHDNNRSVDQARRVADKIHHELGKTYEVESHEFTITPTIGVTLFPEVGKTADMLLQEADSAMYQGKADGRNTTKFFHPNMQSEAQTRLALERDLRTAAERDELSLYYQPQYDRSGALFAAEALLRWNHPARGFVSPALFIPIAEESGLILELSRWVFQTALNQLHRWDLDGQMFIDHLAINVSSKQFRSAHFVRDTTRDLVATGVVPSNVVLEVTEGTVIENFAETTQRMSALREMGIRFSVDDFGVGYSSLAYLSKLPLDQLKIDRSFVTNVLTDESDAVIAETIIGMGRNLGLETIAEGVETADQHEFLLSKGCDGFQGYRFSPAVPNEDFLELPRQIAPDIEALS